MMYLVWGGLTNLHVEVLAQDQVLLVGGLHALLQSAVLLGPSAQLGVQTRLQLRHLGFLCFQFLARDGTNTVSVTSSLGLNSSTTYTEHH